MNSLDAAMAFIWYAAGEVGTGVYHVPPALTCRQIGMYRGILSHRFADKVPHESVAMQEVQDRRMNKIVPGTGKRLHDYANIYFCARNPMLYKRKDTHTELCVLRISTAVFADDWRHPSDELEYLKHRSIKCAEVLVPDRVPRTYITGAYVSCIQSQAKTAKIASDLKITIDPHLFFLEVRP